MLSVLYRWQIEPGMEEQFVDGWYRGTRANHASCGRYRQHRAANGTRFAYARWPEAARRDACDHGESEGLRLMTEATAYVEQLPADVVLDLLAPSDQSTQTHATQHPRSQS